MSGTNHVTGGIVFTGIFASFWNLNIFSTPSLLAFTAFFSILPDIDHLKSPIGKLFYPISKFLDRNYGHRTITHSLLAYTILGLSVAFIEKIFFNELNVTLVFIFSYLSHLIYDMMTKAGVPLYYPFRRNPCVIPGNPDLRLKSSDLKTEATVFTIFLVLGLTCQPLFVNGFWHTYNSAFSDLKHLHQQVKQSENLLSIEYNFQNENGKTISGKGFSIKSTDNQVVIFDSLKFIKITNSDKILSLTLKKTNKVLTTSDYLFYNITPDSLNKLVRNKPIINIKIQSNSSFTFIKENKPQKGKSTDLDYVLNPLFTFDDDSLNKEINNRIELLKFELSTVKETELKLFKTKIKLKQKIDNLYNQSNNDDLYLREKAIKELKEAKTELEKLNDNEDKTGKIKIQIKQLSEESEAKNKISISGYIVFLNS
jgi:inner membrane protein